MDNYEENNENQLTPSEKRSDGTVEAEATSGQRSLTGLTKKERRQLRREEKISKLEKSRKSRSTKKILTWLIVVLVLGGAVYGLGKFVSNTPKLPPKSSLNHIEESPPSHIVLNPIPENIQRHMFEHADGKGKPGVIIQYNCDRFECEDDLVANLTSLVEQFPDNVYLAPNDYDGKIILTKEGELEILDSFDEEIIRNFIGE